MTDVRPPVADWATDFDHQHPDYAANATEIWDELRDDCPIAHTNRYGGAWFPTRHEDIAAISKDVVHFSSQGVVVTEERPDIPAPMGYAPPITSDPPFHSIARSIMLKFFSPKAIDAWEPTIRETCRRLIADIKTKIDAGETTIDIAANYSQHIPVSVMADMLGLPRQDGDVFRGFIHNIMEQTGEEPPYEESMDFYLDTHVAKRRSNLGDDLISYLCQADIEGMPLLDEHVRGTIGLLIIAGIDTTWSAIGAGLWHMAQSPKDRDRWTNDPSVQPTALEEILRFYAPVTMARLIAEDIELGGCPMKAGDWTLLPFPAANRDPEAFEQADKFVIDRARNRHSAFGLGIHRCVGSNLARLEVRIAMEEWMAAFPDFELANPEAVTWSTGQVRGPRQLPVLFLG
ncbi:MAG: cytochrome P450 [Acidimicrobiales bacterium]|jgi:cytochrome P450|nr:cytochrome P450 [Acidimicrobiales bacterium]MDG2218578.1 cytochrome P450 [Acidimicrobiales bacterium]